VPDLRVHRDHILGLEPARDIARRWMDDARDRFNLRCECEPGAESDTIRFQGPGVSGTLRVAGDAFDLDARLGFLLGPFSRRIEQEIASQLDAMLGP
jgi:putative polyhydroxyalkanoate system protein